MTLNSAFVESVGAGHGYGFDASARCPTGFGKQPGYVNVNGECVLYENVGNAPAFVMAPGQSREPVLVDNQRYGTFTPINPF